MFSAPPPGSGTTAAQTAAMNANNAVAVNAQIRALILGNSVSVKQSIFNKTVTSPGNTNNVFQIPFRNVGLVKGFIVKVTANFANIGSGQAALTTWNIGNLLSNITMFDMDNYQRINTSGIHMNAVATSKEGFPQGAAIVAAGMDSPIKYGNNFSAVNASATLAASTGTGSAVQYYYVPCAFSGTDLRGAIFAGVVNATAYLQLTVNPNPGSASGDPTLAVYSGANTNVAISSVTIQVYQDYLDQLPRYPSGPNAGEVILPPLDVATQYRLNSTSLTGVSIGQDFPIPFSNFQQFLSLLTIYDQAGTLNAGTDINYFALAAANTYQTFNIDPITQAWLSRHKIMTDWPLGTYMFDFRNAPVSTNQTGNMQLLLNAISAASGSQVLAGFESLALVNNVLGAASLPAS